MERNIKNMIAQPTYALKNAKEQNATELRKTHKTELNPWIYTKTEEITEKKLNQMKKDRKIKWIVRIAAMIAVMAMGRGEIQAQRQQGHVGGRYFGRDNAALYSSHSSTLPTANLNQSTASNGLMINPGTIVQVQCATPSSGAIFELVGFSIGTPSASPTQFTGSLLTNHGLSTANYNTQVTAWQNMRTAHQAAGVYPSHNPNTTTAWDGAIWLIVNWGQGANARYELTLNNQWQLVPRYGIFFQYEINQEPPCSYTFEFLQVQGYRCSGTIQGTAPNRTCSSPATSSTLYYSDLKIFNGMPRTVTVLNTQNDPDTRLQIDNNQNTIVTQYTVCASDVSGRNFMDMSAFRCPGDRFVQFEYVNNTSVNIVIASTSGGTALQTLAPGASRRDGGTLHTTANQRRQWNVSSSNTRSQTPSNFIRLAPTGTQSAQNAEYIEVRMYSWNSCTGAPAANPTDADRARVNATMRVARINIAAPINTPDPQTFDYCFPVTGISNNYATTRTVNFGGTPSQTGVYRYYYPNASNTGPGTYFYQTATNVAFDPTQTYVNETNRLIPGGTAAQRTKSYWVTFAIVSTDGQFCESPSARIDYRVRENISAAPGITGPTTVCANTTYRYNVTTFEASMGNPAQPLTYVWMDGAGYTIVGTSTGDFRTGEWADIRFTTAAQVRMFRQWTNAVNRPPTCTNLPSVPGFTVACGNCFSTISSHTVSINPSPSGGTISGGSVICGDIETRQLTLTGLTGGTSYNVNISDGTNVTSHNGITNGYEFTVTPNNAATTTYTVTQITAVNTTCENTDPPLISASITKRPLLSSTGATITTVPTPICEGSEFTATLAGVTVTSETEVVWRYNNETVQRPGSNTFTPEETGTATASRSIEATWRYIQPTETGGSNRCDAAMISSTLTISQAPVAVVSPASTSQSICQGSGASVTIGLSGGTAGNPFIVEWEIHHDAILTGTGTATSANNATSHTIDIPASMLNSGRGSYTFSIASVSRAGSCIQLNNPHTTGTIVVEQTPTAVFAAPLAVPTCEDISYDAVISLGGEPVRGYVVEYTINGDPQIALRPSMQPAGVLTSDYLLEIPASQVKVGTVTVQITSVRQEGGQACSNNALPPPLVLTVSQIDQADPNITGLPYSVCVETFDGSEHVIYLEGNVLASGYEGEWTLLGSSTPLPRDPRDPTAANKAMISSFTPDLYTAVWTIWRGNRTCFSRRTAEVFFAESTTVAEVFYAEDEVCYDMPYELWAVRPNPIETGRWEIWEMELENTSGVKSHYGSTWWAVTSVIPPGLSLNAGNGIISGRPRTAGTYTFSLIGLNGVGVEVPGSNITYTLVIVPAGGVDPGTGNIPYGEVGTVYGYTLPSVAGVEQWRVTSLLPRGLELNSETGVISGTPTVNGVYNFQITEYNLDGNIVTPYYVVIAPGTGTGVGTPITAGTEGVVYSHTLTRSATSLSKSPMPSDWGGIEDATDFRTGVNVNINELGRYKFRWIVSGGCGSLSDFTTITFHPKPIVRLETNLTGNPNLNSLVLCPEREIEMPDFVTVNAGNNIINDAGFVYRWLFSGTAMEGFNTEWQTGQFPTGRQTPLTLSATAADVFNVGVEVSNGMCWSDRMNVRMELRPKPPQVEFSRSSLCEGDEVTMRLYENVNLWQNTRYNWTMTHDVIVPPSSSNYTASGLTGEFRADDEAPPFQFRFATKNGTSAPITSTFSATATVNGCTSDVAHLPLVVNPKPKLTFDAQVNLTTLPNGDIIGYIEECPNDAAGVPIRIMPLETTLHSTVLDTKYTWLWNGSPIGFIMPPTVSGEDFTFNNTLGEFQLTDNTSTGRLGGTMTISGETFGCISEPMTLQMWVRPRPDIRVPIVQTVCPEPGLGGTFPSITFRSSNLPDDQVDYAWIMTPPSGAEITYTIVIAPSGGTPPTVGGALPSGEVNVPYSYTLTNSTWTLVDSDLPNGLTFSNATGIISGTPTEEGMFYIKIVGGPISGSGNVPPAAALTFGDNNTSETVDNYAWSVVATGNSNGQGHAAGCVSTLATPLTMGVFPRPNIVVNNPNNTPACSGNNGLFFENITFNTGGISSTFVWNVEQPPAVNPGIITTGVTNFWGTSSSISFSGVPLNTSAATVAGGGTATYVAEITINATSSDACISDPKTTELTILQKPLMNTPAALELCSGATQPAIGLSTANDVTPASYSWRMIDPDIWTSGSGTLTNTTTQTMNAFTVVANKEVPIANLETEIEVWATHTNTCPSDRVRFPVTVRPEISINLATSAITVCPGDMVNIPVFTTNVYGSDASMITWEYLGADVSAEEFFTSGDEDDGDGGTVWVDRTIGSGNITNFIAKENSAPATTQITGTFRVTAGSHWSETNRTCESPDPVDIVVSINPTPAAPTILPSNTTLPIFLCHDGPARLIDFTIPAGSSLSWTSNAPEMTGAENGTGIGDDGNQISVTPINSTPQLLFEHEILVTVRSNAGTGDAICPSIPLPVPIIIRPVPRMIETYPSTIEDCSDSGFTIPEFELHTWFMTEGHITDDNDPGYAGRIRPQYSWSIAPVLGDGEDELVNWYINNGNLTGALTGNATAHINNAPVTTAPPLPVDFIPVIIGNVSRSLQLIVTPSFAGCDGVALPVPIVINPTPVISIAGSPTLAVCSDERFSTMVFQSTVTPMASWNWQVLQPAGYTGSSNSHVSVRDGGGGPSQNSITFNPALNPVNTEDANYVERIILDPANLPRSSAAMGSCPAKLDQEYTLTIHQAPTLNTIPNVIACSGEIVPAITFPTGSATPPANMIYRWVSTNATVWEEDDDPAVVPTWFGLEDEGELTTPLFPVFKTRAWSPQGNTPLPSNIAIVTVTAESEIKDVIGGDGLPTGEKTGTGCSTTRNFTVEVKPLPQLLQGWAVPNIETVVCVDDAVANPLFRTNVAGPNDEIVFWKIRTGSHDIFGGDPDFKIDDGTPAFAWSNGNFSFDADNSTSNTATPVQHTAIFDIIVRDRHHNNEPGALGPAICESEPYSMTIKVHPKPVISNTGLIAGNIYEICNNEPVSEITFTTSPKIDFTGDDDFIMWRRISGAVLDLPAMGSNEDDEDELVFEEITSFPASLQLQTANFSVTAGVGVRSSDGSSCTATPVNFTIRVKPRPELARYQNTSIPLCSGADDLLSELDEFMFDARFDFFHADGIELAKYHWEVTTGEVPPYLWYTDNTVVDISTFPDATGAWATGLIEYDDFDVTDPQIPFKMWDNLTSFKPVLRGVIPRQMTLRVTPEYADCLGNPTSVLITLNPTPNIRGVDPNVEMLACAGDAFPTINLASDAAGAEFRWIFENIDDVTGVSPAPYAGRTPTTTADILLGGESGSSITFDETVNRFNTAGFTAKLEVRSVVPETGCESPPLTQLFRVYQTPLMNNFTFDEIQVCEGETYGNIAFSISNTVPALERYRWEVELETPPDEPVHVWVTPYNSGNAFVNATATGANQTTLMPQFTTVENTQEGAEKEATISVYAVARHVHTDTRETVCESKTPAEFTIILKPRPEITNTFADLSLCPAETVALTDIPNFTFNLDANDWDITPYWTLTHTAATPTDHYISSYFATAANRSGTSNIYSVFNAAGGNRAGVDIVGEFTTRARIPRELNTVIHTSAHNDYCETPDVAAKKFLVTVKPTPNTPELYAWDDDPVTDPLDLFDVDYCPGESIPEHYFKTSLTTLANVTTDYHADNSANTAFFWDIVDATGAPTTTTIGLTKPATPGSHIPSFTAAANSTLTTLSARILVYATLNGCRSDHDYGADTNDDLDFLIKIKPTPRVNPALLADFAVCSQSAVTIPAFTLHPTLLAAGGSEYPEDTTDFDPTDPNDRPTTVYKWYVTAGDWTNNSSGIPTDLLANTLTSPSDDNETVPSPFTPIINVDPTSTPPNAPETPNNQRSFTLFVIPEHAGCVGDAEDNQLTVTINPRPRITEIDDELIICSLETFGDVQAGVRAVRFSSDVVPHNTGTDVTTYLWDITLPAASQVGYIGLDAPTDPADRTDNSIEFEEAENVTQTIYQATLSITAKAPAAVGGCETIAPHTVLLTVLQAPVMEGISNVEACSGEAFEEYFPLDVTATSMIPTSYSWELENATPLVWTGMTDFSVDYDATETYMNDFAAAVNNGATDISNTVIVWATATHSAAYDNRTCDSKPITFTLAVKPNLLMTDASTAPTAICPNNSITLTPDFEANHGTVHWWVDEQIATASLPTAAAPGTTIPITFTSAARSGTAIVSEFTAQARMNRTSLPLGLPDGSIHNRTYCVSPSVTHTVTLNPTPETPEIAKFTDEDDDDITPSTSWYPAINTLVFCTGNETPNVYLADRAAASTLRYEWTETGDNIGTISYDEANYWRRLNMFTTENPTTDRLSPATRTFSVIARENNCPSTALNITITVKPVPQMLANYHSGGITLCSGEGVAINTFDLRTFTPYTNGLTPGYTWTLANIGSTDWLTAEALATLPALATPSTTAPDFAPTVWFTPDNTGANQRHLRLTVTPDYEGCEGEDTQVNIFINPRPNIEGLISQEICSWNTFENMALSAGNVTDPVFNWTITPSATQSDVQRIGAASLSGTNSTSISFNATAINVSNAAEYTASISVTAEDALNCDATATATLTVLRAPVMIAPEDLVACADELITVGDPAAVPPIPANKPVQFSVAANDAAVATYHWRAASSVALNAGSVGDAATAIAPADAYLLPFTTAGVGSETEATITAWAVTTTAAGACASQEQTFKIRVRPKPQVSSFPQSPVICPDLPLVMTNFLFASSPATVTAKDPADANVPSEVHWTIDNTSVVTPTLTSPGQGSITTPLTSANTSGTIQTGTFTLWAQYEDMPECKTDATDNRTFSVTVHPKPETPTIDIAGFDPNDIPDPFIAYCHGDIQIAPIEFLSANNFDISWINVGVDIGFGADTQTPSAQIDNFTAGHISTLQARIANINVIATSPAPANCPSDPLLFNLLLKPVPQMEPWATNNIFTICSSIPNPMITPDGYPAGGYPASYYTVPKFELLSTITYREKDGSGNDVPPEFEWLIPDLVAGQGLNAAYATTPQKSDQITGLLPVNTAAGNMEMTIEITPWNAGCPGVEAELFLRILPLPQVNNIAELEQEICSESHFGDPLNSNRVRFSSNLISSMIEKWNWEIIPDATHPTGILGVLDDELEGDTRDIFFPDKAVNNSIDAYESAVRVHLVTTADCVGPEEEFLLTVFQTPVMKPIDRINICNNIEYEQAIELSTLHPADVEYYTWSLSTTVPNQNIWNITSTGTVPVVSGEISKMPAFEGISPNVGLTRSGVVTITAYSNNSLACEASTTFDVSAWFASSVANMPDLELCPGDEDVRMPLLTSPAGYQVNWVSNTGHLISDAFNPATGTTSGSGDILGPFTAVENRTALDTTNPLEFNGEDITGSFELKAVTRHFPAGSPPVECISKSRTVAIIVHPTPRPPMFKIANPVLDFCDNTQVGEIEFVSETDDVLYRWEQIGGDNVGQLETFAGTSLTLNPGHFRPFRASHAFDHDNMTPSVAMYEAFAVKEGCPSEETSLIFPITVIPVPQIDPYLDISFCADETWNVEPFVMHQTIQTGYQPDKPGPNGIPVQSYHFEWRIDEREWFVETGIASPLNADNTIRWYDSADWVDFTPDIDKRIVNNNTNFRFPNNYLKPGADERHPLWGRTERIMTLLVIPRIEIPEYNAVCYADRPAAIDITIYPLPVTNIVTNELDDCVTSIGTEQYGVKVFLSNNGAGTPGSSFNWSLDHITDFAANPSHLPNVDPSTQGNNVVSIIFPDTYNMEEYRGLLYVSEENEFGCVAALEEPFSITAVPRPMVKFDDKYLIGSGDEMLFEMCTNSYEVVSGVLLNKGIFAHRPNDVDFQWFTTGNGLFLPPYLADQETPNDLNSETPAINANRPSAHGVTTMVGFQVLDVGTNCRSNTAYLPVTVYASPVTPPLSMLMVCENFDERNPQMTMKVADDDGTTGLYYHWYRVEETLPGSNVFAQVENIGNSVDGRQDMYTVDLVDHIPTLTWASGDDQQSLYYQVYRSFLSPATTRPLTCYSQARVAEVLINRTPANPILPYDFNYCEDTNWAYYEMRAEAQVDDFPPAGFSWYDPAGNFVSPGDVVSINQAGNIVDNNANQPFMYSVAAMSMFNCRSELVDAPLTIFKNPELEHTLTNIKTGEIITSAFTDGCAPFDVLGEIEDWDNPTIRYTWEWQPGNFKEVTQAQETTTYYIGGTNPEVFRMSVEGVSLVDIDRITGEGCRTTVTRQLIINPGVTARFLSTDTIGCHPTTIGFSNLSQGAFDFRWYWVMPDGVDEPPYPGSLVNPGPVVNPLNTPGYEGARGPHQFQEFVNTTGEPIEFHVWLQVDNGACYDNLKQVVTVLPTPEAAFVHSLPSGSVCPPERVVFTNNSTFIDNLIEYNSVTQYRWSYGDGFLETVPFSRDTISHAYQNWVSSTPTPRMITLTAFNEYEFEYEEQNETKYRQFVCSTSANRQIMINPQVEANFAGPWSGGIEHTQACSPFIAQFTNQSIGSVSSFAWDFGDGTGQSSASSPTHTFISKTRNLPETLDIVFTASNNWCSSTVNRQLILLPQPGAMFTIDGDVQGCHPLTIQFENTSQGNMPPANTDYFHKLFYEFEFDDGYAERFDDDERRLIHRYHNSLGSNLHRTPSMRAIGEWVVTPGDTISCISLPARAATVTIFPLVFAEFEIQGDNVCSPAEVRLMNGSQGFETYEYHIVDDLGNILEGSIITGNRESSILQSHTFIAPTMYEDVTYNLQLVVKTGNCSDAITKPIHVYSQPTAAFRPANTSYVFPAPPVSFDNLIPISERNQLEYMWTWKEVNSNYINNFSRTTHPTPLNIPEWGEFDITQRVDAPNNKCYDTQTIRLTIVPPITTPNFSETLPDCAPYTVTFSNQSRFARYFVWDFGDGYTSNETNPTHTFMTPGVYTVKLTAYGEDMSVRSIEREITVLPTPQAGFTVKARYLYVGQPLEVNNYSVAVNLDGTPMDVWYRWDFGDRTQPKTEVEPQHYYMNSGTFTVSLTVGTNSLPECSTSMILENIIEIENQGNIVLPNIFRPDQNGERDDEIPDIGYRNFLFFPSLMSPVAKYHFVVYNRLGVMVFETKDPTKGWNGYYRGNLCPEDVYTFKVEGVFQDGKPFLRVGTVLLSR